MEGVEPFGLDYQSSARHERLKTVSGRPLAERSPMCSKPLGAIRDETPALWTRVPARSTAAPLGRTAMSSEARRPDSLARTRPPGAALSRSGLSRTLPEVGDTRGGRDRTHARTPWAPRCCSRSRIAFSRRTSRKTARNKSQRNSCQLPGQAPGSTTSARREDGPAHRRADALCRSRRVVRGVVTLEDECHRRAADPGPGPSGGVSQVPTRPAVGHAASPQRPPS